VLPAPSTLVLDFMLSVLPRVAPQAKGQPTAAAAAASQSAARPDALVEGGRDRGQDASSGGAEGGGQQQQQQLDDGSKMRKHKANKGQLAAGAAPASLPTSFKVPALYADFAAL
jgi:hypothetical protein